MFSGEELSPGGTACPPSRSIKNSVVLWRPASSNVLNQNITPRHFAPNSRTSCWSLEKVSAYHSPQMLKHLKGSRLASLNRCPSLSAKTMTKSRPGSMPSKTWVKTSRTNSSVPDSMIIFAESSLRVTKKKPGLRFMRLPWNWKSLRWTKIQSKKTHHKCHCWDCSSWPGVWPWRIRRN